MGWPTWVMVWTARPGPSWSACVAKESSTAPETSRNRAVAGSASAKTRSAAWNAIIRAWPASSARSCGSNPSKNGEPASSSSVSALMACPLHRWLLGGGHRRSRVCSKRLARLLAAHRGGVPVWGAEGRPADQLAGATQHPDQQVLLADPDQDLHRPGQQEVDRPSPVGLTEHQPAGGKLLLRGRLGQTDQRPAGYALEERQAPQTRQLHGALPLTWTPRRRSPPPWEGERSPASPKGPADAGLSGPTCTSIAPARRLASTTTAGCQRWRAIRLQLSFLGWTCDVQRVGGRHRHAVDRLGGASALPGPAQCNSALASGRHRSPVSGTGPRCRARPGSPARQSGWPETAPAATAAPPWRSRRRPAGPAPGPASPRGGSPPGRGCPGRAPDRRSGAGRPASTATPAGSGRCGRRAAPAGSGRPGPTAPWRVAG